LQIATALGLGALLAALLIRLKGRRRVHVAGVIGALGAVVSLSSLSVFWHGVVISALPATPARLVCGLALVCGAAGAGLSFLPEAGRPPSKR
jgi:MFS family permease